MFIRRPQDIGALVRTTRIAKKLNQQELAERLGVSRWWVNELEGGKATSRMDLVLRALNELEITLVATTDDETARQTIPDPGTKPVIDIDAIANTGLEQKTVPKSRKTKGRRR